ncbi:MAG: nuclear transport factor 2 family protein, partial [marine benthic group bacterium]|nr:nuclear transport factor 2 family protein [Gemmatimonadota bacterium]
ILEKRIRLLSPDIAVLTAVSEGTYTDKAGWTSEPVGIGHTIIFVRENGTWRARHVHQSIAR